MLIGIGKETKGTYIGGLKDVICILKSINTNRYYVCSFEENPFEYQLENPMEEVELIRLKIKKLHTAGTDTYDEALVHLETISKRIGINEKNIWKEPKEWDGNAGIVWIVTNWQEE